MNKLILAAALAFPAAANGQAGSAQPAPTTPSDGTRLEIIATGEVARAPDIARIAAGVATQAPTAAAALSANSQAMTRVIAALRRAGVAERDIRTNAVNLSPNYRYAENQPPVVTGYGASNQVTIRFRDVAQSGAILDALVREGANQISGPSLEIDRPEGALDEARVEALATARARADLYARAAGLRVTRILSISESGGYQPPSPPPMYAARGMAADAAETRIVPGEQAVQVQVQVAFELR